MTDAPTLTLFTIYERPLDFPDEFVARRYEIANAEPLATEHVLRSGELAQLRRDVTSWFREHRHMKPMRLSRSPGDDACIVEVWL